MRKRWCPRKFLKFPGKSWNSTTATSEAEWQIWYNVKQGNFKIQSSNIKQFSSDYTFLLLFFFKLEFFVYLLLILTYEAFFLNSHRFNEICSWIIMNIRRESWPNSKSSFFSYIKLTPEYLQESSWSKNFPSLYSAFVKF